MIWKDTQRRCRRCGSLISARSALPALRLLEDVDGPCPMRMIVREYPHLTWNDVYMIVRNLMHIGWVERVSRGVYRLTRGESE